MMPMPAGPGGPPMGPGPGGNVPVGPGPKSEPGAGSPDEIKQQLKMLLMKAKEIAQQNGVDFSAIVAEVEGKGVRSDVPLPRPPQAPGMP